MSEPIKIEFTLPSDCPKDIELMSIWVQATEHYMSELTPTECRAALVWFNSYLGSKVEHL